MKILHKEGSNITIWVYSDEGLPLYSVVVQSDTVTEMAAQQSASENLIDFIIDDPRLSGKTELTERSTHENQSHS